MGVRGPAVAADPAGSRGGGAGPAISGPPRESLPRSRPATARTACGADGSSRRSPRRRAGRGGEGRPQRGEQGSGRPPSRPLHPPLFLARTAASPPVRASASSRPSAARPGRRASPTAPSPPRAPLRAPRPGSAPARGSVPAGRRAKGFGRSCRSPQGPGEAGHTALTGHVAPGARRIRHRAPPPCWPVACLFVKRRIRSVKVRRRLGHMRTAVSLPGGARHRSRKASGGER